MFKTSSKNKLFVLVTVLVMVFLRLILMGTIPLLDKTESRYGEIARLMLETKEWIMPQIDYGIPFWAKPPLSTWLSSISMLVFGTNEFAIRLPSFLLSILLIVILGKYVIKDIGKSIFLAFILLTIPEFYLHTGVVSTDTALCFSATLIMISFWKSMQSSQYNIWNYVFFVAIAFGLLSKGPLVLVLTGPPILIWLIVQKVSPKKLYGQLPWIKGILITALISIPWFLIAEKKSPGFLNYFFVGEHFKRFIEPRWHGDLYGSGHTQPLGMIWVLLLVFAFPWIQIVCLKIFKDRKSILKDPWVIYLLFWLVWIPFFFTFSKNILHTYILPSTVPLALLVTHLWDDYKPKKMVLGLALIFPVIVLVGSVALKFNDGLMKKMNTDKFLITKTNKELPYFYWKNETYSSNFYSDGKIKTLENKIQLDSVLLKYDKFYILISDKYKNKFPTEYLTKGTIIDSNYKTSIYLFEDLGIKREQP